MSEWDIVISGDCERVNVDRERVNESWTTVKIVNDSEDRGRVNELWTTAKIVNDSEDRERVNDSKDREHMWTDVRNVNEQRRLPAYNTITWEQLYCDNTQ